MTFESFSHSSICSRMISMSLWNISSLQIFKEQVSRKYREPPSFSFSQLLSLLSRFEHFGGVSNITMKIYFCTNYTRATPQLLCFVRSIIYLKFDNDSKNDTFCLKIQKESLSINFPSTNKKFCVCSSPGKVYENENSSLIISGDEESMATIYPIHRRTR